MAHDIDITDGTASFVTARLDAWHALGTKLDHSFTALEAMEEGRLGGWDVRKAPLYTRIGGDERELADRFAVLRNNPVVPGRVDVLSTVGTAYQIIQNEEHAALLDAVVDESGAHFETAGALDAGRKVFITLRLPNHIDVGGVDRVDQYLAAVNSHDGTTAFTFFVTPVRVVCANTLNIALGSARNTFRVRHTSGAKLGIVNQAREVLDMSFRYLGEFQEQAEQLINTEMTEAAFLNIIRAEYGAAADAGAATRTRADNRLDEIEELFAVASTQDGIRGTAWAGFNALTEWADHYSPSRGDERDVSRATWAVLDPTFKNRAFALMAGV